jgi:hypothetical protein
VKLTVMVITLFILEPGLVAWSGGTIGHRAAGLRVRQKEGGSNLGIVRAVIRFVVKAVAGFLSLAFIMTTRRYQALHDMAGKSVVIDVRPESRSYNVSAGEQIVENDQFEYPSPFRRISVVIVYIVLALILFGIINALALSGACLDDNNCAGTEFLTELVLGIIELVALLALIVFGWRGRIWGARRKPRSGEPGIPAV